LKNSAQGRINYTLVLDQKEETSQGSTEREKEERKVHLQSSVSVWSKQEVIIKPVIGYAKCKAEKHEK